MQKAYVLPFQIEIGQFTAILFLFLLKKNQALTYKKNKNFYKCLRNRVAKYQLLSLASKYPARFFPGQYMAMTLAGTSTKTARVSNQVKLEAFVLLERHTCDSG